MERKLATVLFVDLVGSTELVAARDPEVVRRRVNSFFEHVSHGITTHGGIVEKFAGDAVMAAFGVPQAHEDDAKKVIAIGESKPEEKLPPTQLAAWTMATNELLNLDEVLNK